MQREGDRQMISEIVKYNILYTGETKMCKLFAHPGCCILTTYLLARRGTPNIHFWTGVQKMLQANHRFAKKVFD